MTLIIAAARTLAAALALGATSQAAERDAPMRACPSEGPGFYEVPGTRTCLKISGQVRSEWGGASGRGRDQTGSRVGGRGDVDARTRTEAGPMRAFVRVGSDRR